MNRFAQLPPADRRQLIEEAARNKAIPPAMVEKDFWVCWALMRLFGQHWLRTRLMFKGGTSLAKAHGLIQRMSEDIDLIIPPDGYTQEYLLEDRSRTQQAKLLDEINAQLPEYVRTQVLPHLQEALGDICTLEQDDHHGGHIHVQFPVSFPTGYLRPAILLELGPQAEWTPNDTYEITPFVAEELPGLSFDQRSCRVPAIRAERTFWEKAAILHEIATQPDMRADATPRTLRTRYSRHYYDLAMLARSGTLREQALADHALLAGVVRYRERVWRENQADYAVMRPGSFKLVPSAHFQRQLAADYAEMREMLYGQPPQFQEILVELSALEQMINA